MATCYKNFPVIITYEDSTTETFYSNSVSLSEDVSLESAQSLGVKGSTAVFNRAVPNGQISVESYVDTSLLKSLDLIRSNAQNVKVEFGPYETPLPCVLSSMSMSITVGEPITLSREYAYYGSVITNSLPTVSAPSITPLVPEGISLSGYDAIGGSTIISDISWSVNQEYEQFNLLGDTTPVVVYRSAQKTLDINGEALTQSLMQSASAGCVVPPKEYSVGLVGCNNQDLGTLGITGYMQSRSSSVEPESVEQNSVSIIQYL